MIMMMDITNDDADDDEKFDGDGDNTYGNAGDINDGDYDGGKGWKDFSGFPAQWRHIFIKI